MMGPDCSVATERPARLHQRVWRIFPVFLFFPVFVLAGGSFAYAAPIGSITALHGSVTLKRPGEERPRSLVSGDAFAVGDEIRTGPSSGVQVTFSDESFVNLDPETSMRVNQYAFDTATDRRTARVKITGGRARFVLYKARRGASDFYVETNNARAAAGVFGDFGIRSLPGGTEVAALANSVSVVNISNLIIGTVNVGMNQKTVVKDKTPPSAPVTLTREERKSYLKDVRRLQEGD